MKWMNVKKRKKILRISLGKLSSVWWAVFSPFHQRWMFVVVQASHYEVHSLQFSLILSGLFDNVFGVSVRYAFHSEPVHDWIFNIFNRILTHWAWMWVTCINGIFNVDGMIIFIQLVSASVAIVDVVWKVDELTFFSVENDCLHAIFFE